MMTGQMRDGAILRAMTSGPVTRAVSRHFCFVVILGNVFVTARTFAGEAPLKQIKLPAGFEIAIFADNIRDARSMVLGPKGTVFVGTRGAGKVYALAAQAEENARRVITVAEGLKSPNGAAFHNGALYVAEISRVLRYDDIEARLNSPPKPVIVSDSFPIERTHGWKFIAFGPDGKLYVPVGAPCNICEPDPERYAIIARMNPDGSDLEVYARGLRFSVGFDWDPRTKELWFTANGRDWLGDDLPPDTLNHAPKPGLNFGYPYCHAGSIVDPEFGRRQACSAFAPPVQKLGPHVAALGMRFYTGSQFPAQYRNQVFIAEHGSWNRSRKIGYRVTVVRLDATGKAVGYEPFAEGWLQGESTWGRPAD